MRRPGRFVILLSLLAACGQASNGAVVVESAESPAAGVGVSEPTVASIKPSTPTIDTGSPVEASSENLDPVAVSRHCDIEWKTISTALEVHYAQYGYDAQSIDDLVPGLLSDTPDGWSIEVGDHSVPVATADESGPCAGYDPDAPPPSSDEPVSGTAASCFDQRLVLEALSNVVFAQTGERPTSQAPYIADGLLPFETDLYDFDGSGAVTALFDGECTIASADQPQPFETAPPECYPDWLTVVVTAHFHHVLVGSHADSASLIADGFLDRPITSFEVDDTGFVSATGAGGCPLFEEIDADQQQSRACEVEQRTIETAIEAYLAQTRADVTSLDDLVPDYLRDLPEYWVLTASPAPGLAPTIEPVVGGRCDQ